MMDEYVNEEELKMYAISNVQKDEILRTLRILERHLARNADVNCSIVHNQVLGLMHRLKEIGIE